MNPGEFQAWVTLLTQNPLVVVVLIIIAQRLHAFGRDVHSRLLGIETALSKLADAPRRNELERLHRMSPGALGRAPAMDPRPPGSPIP